ncbi:retrovirus-related pol polyprotein from transposon TNT 1-94 [Tanacetum coccineum]
MDYTHPMITDPQPMILLSGPAPSQGLPRHIFNNLNQTSTAKEIWENVEMLMTWIGRLSTKEEDLFINIPNYIRSILISKARASCQKESLRNKEQSTSIVDHWPIVLTPILNLLFHPSQLQVLNHSTVSDDDLTHATVHDGQIVTEPVQRKAPGNNGNTGARGKKVICYNCRGEGHVARQCKEPKRKLDSQYFKDKALLMEAKEKGDVLDAEAEAFLADVECTAPWTSPWNEGPMCYRYHGQHLSSPRHHNPVNEVHSNDNQIFDNVDYQRFRSAPGKKHLDSDVR